MRGFRRLRLRFDNDDTGHYILLRIQSAGQERRAHHVFATHERPQQVPCPYPTRYVVSASRKLLPHTTRCNKPTIPTTFRQQPKLKHFPMSERLTLQTSSCSPHNLNRYLHPLHRRPPRWSHPVSRKFASKRSESSSTDPQRSGCSWHSRWVVTIRKGERGGVA